MKPLRVIAKTALFAALTLLMAPPSALALLIFYGRRKALGRRLMQTYSRACLWIFNCRIRVEGSMRHASGLILANHASFLDVFVLSAAFGSSFVSKAEVRKYPLFGQMGALIGIIFLDRASNARRHGLIKQLASLAHEQAITVFPQGTTSPNHNPVPFNRGVFKVVDLNPDVRLLPVTIAYEEHRTIYWAKGASLIRNFVDICSLGGISVVLHVHEPVTSEHYEQASAQEVCLRVESTVLAPLAQPLEAEPA